MTNLDGQHKICIVDDDIEFSNFVQRYLTALGHRVNAYTTPQAFVQDIEALDCEIFIIDLMLPGMDGIDLVSLIRAHCDAGIIVVSGRLGADAFTTALAAGSDMFINKPVRADQIAQAIATLKRRLKPNVKASQLTAWRLAAERRSLTTPTGVEIKLGEIETRIIVALCKAETKGCSRSELAILAGVAPSTDDRNLDAAVFRLRRKIEGRTGEPAPIVTRSKKGYTVTAHIKVENVK